jgi:hypothetical protein
VIVKEDSRTDASLFPGPFWWIPGGEASLFSVQKEMRRKAQVTGMSLLGGPVG